MLHISKKILYLFDCMYIYIPVALFVLLWCKWTIALYVLSLTILCLYRFYKSIHNDVDIEIDMRFALVILLFFIFIGVYCGWGRFTDQTLDWIKHNAVLYDLVDRSWPVYYSNGNEKSMLSYYIAQYIVPSAVGKLLGFRRIAEVALYLWNVLGLALVYLHLIMYAKAKKMHIQLISALLLVFFCVPLLAEQALVKLISRGVSGNYSMHWLVNEPNTLRLQYSSNFVMLRWVFPQCLAIWIMLLMFLDNKSKIKYYLFIILPGVLFSTLPFLGLIPLGIAAAIDCLIKEKDTIKVLKQIFSLENICMIAGCGLVMILYLYGNVLSDKPSHIGLHIVNYSSIPDGWIYYFSFILGVLVYAFILFDENKTSFIYYAAIITLCILPFFSMGEYNDLVMRASIPALFVLLVLIIKFINKFFDTLKKPCSKLLLIVTLLIGFYYPSRELFKAVQTDEILYLGNRTEPTTLEVYANRSIDEDADLKYNYFAYDIEDNLFYKYIARRKVW